MNLLQIRTQARTLVAESSTTVTYSSDSDLNGYINEGIKDMCVKGKVYEKTKSTTILSGYASYVLPLDFLSFRSIANPNGVTLEQIEPSGVGRVFIVVGKPIYFFVSDNPLTLTTRANDTYYYLGDILVPAAANGYMYEVVVAGMVGSSPPSYPTNPGTRVVDNNATLACREMSTTGYKVTLVDTPTTAGGGTGTYTIIYHALDEGLFVDTDSPNFPEDKHHYLVLFAMFRHYVKTKDLTRATAIYNDYATGVGITSPSPYLQQGATQ